MARASEIIIKFNNPTVQECRTGPDTQRSLEKRKSLVSSEYPVSTQTHRVQQGQKDQAVCWSQFSTHHPNTPVSAPTSKHLPGSSSDLLLTFDIFSYFRTFTYFHLPETLRMIPQNVVLSLLTQHLKTTPAWWLLLKTKKHWKIPETTGERTRTCGARAWRGGRERRKENRGGVFWPPPGILRPSPTLEGCAPQTGLGCAGSPLKSHPKMQKKCDQTWKNNDTSDNATDC